MSTPKIVIRLKSDKPLIRIRPKVKPLLTVEPKLLIGEDTYWEPAELNNFGVLVTGDSGAGKTQMIKAQIHELSLTGVPICILDFKNDYSPDEFSKVVGLEICDVNRYGLGFNPLALVPDKNGESRPIDVVYEFASILARVYGLGAQQHAGLRNAIIAAYEAKGIATDKYSLVTNRTESPSFNDVWDELAKPVKNRLSMLYDLRIFPTEDSGFDSTISKQLVFNLSALPNDKIRSALAEVLIVRLHGHLMKGPQPRKLTRLLVIDEAWRVGDSERLQHLAREGRAFGVGITVGTQFPGDVPSELSGNLDTSIFFHNSDPKHCNAVAQILNADLAKEIGLLKRHEAYFRNSQVAPVKVLTLPHYQREF